MLELSFSDAHLQQVTWGMKLCADLQQNSGLVCWRGPEGFSNYFMSRKLDSLDVLGFFTTNYVAHELLT